MSQQREIDSRTAELVQPATRHILSTHIEPKDDLAFERRRATFDLQELTAMLNEGDQVAKRARLIEMLSKKPWADKRRRHFLTREEEYVGALQSALGIWDMMKSEQINLEEGIMTRILLDFPGGLELHIGMFIPSIRSQGTPEQQAKWLPLCYNLNIIGTYAQTELGHGTFVRGLETTATYDKQTQEFVLHSPTLTSTKWWPGGLGKTATHAVVMARLFIDGKDYGPHGFVVQIRDLDTHLPLPGIKIGDIGPKFGYGGVDNGFMTFDHVRIARDAMLMRYSQVTPEGNYIPPPAANSKASYATMVYVRADIVKNAGLVMARATTIATRYAAVRRQTSPAPGQPELQVLDYQNTSATILPAVAAAYALHFMGETMMGMYKQFEKDRDRGDFSSLPELHALSSGLKALCTGMTAEGIEACRQCCGGHGYSKLSGLPSLFQNYVQNVTWEGDNNVLYLQTARYLIKTLASLKSGQVSSVKGSASYLTNVMSECKQKCSVQAAHQWDSHEAQSDALRHVASRLAVAAITQLHEATSAAARASGKPVPKGGLSFEGPAWNGSTLAMIKLAKAHCMLVLHDNLVSTLTAANKSGKISDRTMAAVSQLPTLLFLSHAQLCMGDYLEDGYVTGEQAQMIRSRFASMLLQVRPNAVAFVDAFAVEDYLLNSALGKQDGDVYRALLEMAKDSPLNDTEEGPAWHGVLKPILSTQNKPAARSRM